MKLSDRVAIISEENINGLSRLYEKLDIDDLSKIVNNHLKVAVEYLRNKGFSVRV